MNYTLLDFLELVGSLGLFLFGMSMMSEGLQKVAGNKMRSILASMTKNRVMGVLTGVVITSVIQSSSATTVMVVSFVNAGLLSLAESISVIMGANIGTTVTAWLVSLVGFKFSIATISIPLIGFAIPFAFSKNDKRKSIGQLMIGFSLLFMGLDFLRASVPDLKSNPEMLHFLANYTDMGFWSVLLFLGIGTILTIVLQSSSATMAMTLVMLNQGWISFEIGAAIVLGENIGTTITANIAALTANTNARRAALSHTLFNVMGVIWLLCLFYPFTRFIEYIMEHITTDPATQPLYALAMFHSLFNVINTFIMLFFIKLYEKAVCFLIKDKADKGEFSLKYITSGMLATGELSLIEAEKEIEFYGERTQQMFTEVRAFAVNTVQDPTNDNTAQRLEHYEDASDKTEIAIADYLHNILGSPVSLDVKKNIRNYLYLTTEIESVSDRCFNISRMTARKNLERVSYTDEQMEDLNRMFDFIERQIAVLMQSIKTRKIEWQLQNEIFHIENDINDLLYELKVKNIDRVNSGTHSYASGIYFMDIIEECESLGDAITKIAKEVKYY